MAAPALADSLAHLRSAVHADAIEALGCLALHSLGGADVDRSLLDFTFDGASGELYSVFRDVKRLFQDALSHAVGDAKFAKVLLKLGIAEGAAASLGRALRKCRDEVVADVRSGGARAVGTSTLQNFDWHVQHVLASDKLHSLGDNLVTLTLDVSGGARGPEHRALAIELSAPELDALIGTLERATGAVPERAVAVSATL